MDARHVRLAGLALPLVGLALAARSALAARAMTCDAVRGGGWDCFGKEAGIFSAWVGEEVVLLAAVLALSWPEPPRVRLAAGAAFCGAAVVYVAGLGRALDAALPSPHGWVAYAAGVPLSLAAAGAAALLARPRQAPVGAGS